MTRKDKATGEKKVIATRRMLQPSKFDLIDDYELAQDSVGDWFSQIGLERGKKRKAAFREAIANGQTPPPKRLHTNTRDWRRKKDRELVKRARDLDGRAEVIQEKSAEADALIAVTEAISQGVVDPADLSAGKPIRAVKGRENDPEFKRTLRHARRSPKGVARVTQAIPFGALATKVKDTRI
jgi:hypothetical protein